MNKPAKLLVAVAVLAFAAAGLYYAWLAPAKKASTTPTVKLTRQDQEGPAVPAETAGRDLRESPTMPASAMPTPVPTTSAPIAPAGVPASAFADPKPASTVPGFVPANEPIKPLPTSGVPGFTPATTTTSAVITTGGASAPAATAPAVPAPAAPVTTAPAATPAASPAPTDMGGTPAVKPSAAPTGAYPSAPAALPALPAPGKPAAVPASTPTPAPKSTKVDTYTVKDGDTIASIWRSITGNERGWEKLLVANPGVDASRLKIGQVLKVPDFAPTGTSGATQTSSTASTTKASGATTYTVESGDTLHRIANKVYGDSKLWNQIYEANKSTIGSDPAVLKVGMKLQIPAKSGAPGKTEAKEPSKSSATTGASTPSAPR